jgi:hypothetical protein
MEVIIIIGAFIVTVGLIIWATIRAIKDDMSFKSYVSHLGDLNDEYVKNGFKEEDRKSLEKATKHLDEKNR